jgi:hypothetical protein
MEARLTRVAFLAAVLCSLGARYKTSNFVVTASTPQIAEQVGQAAEQFRRDLAVDWLGKELPNWAEPCPISVKTGPNMGAGGATSFLFDRGEVYGWRMNIQGSLERVLDSVLPHEVTHTIFASHFRQPLPRWADEGACTTVEHVSERKKQEQMLITFLKTGRGIPFSRMFVMKEYPSDVMPLYSQGYSLARYLIKHGGKQKYLNYLADGLKNEDWVKVTHAHYGFDSLGTLQNSWLDWVRQGSPTDIERGESTTTLASHERRPRPEPNLIYRAQSEDPPATQLVPVERRPAPQRAMPATETGAANEPPASSQPASLGTMGIAASADASTASASNASDVGTVGERWHAPLPAESGLATMMQQPPSDQHAMPLGNQSPGGMVAVAGNDMPAQRSGQVLLQWSRQREAMRFDALDGGTLRR